MEFQTGAHKTKEPDPIKLKYVVVERKVCTFNSFTALTFIPCEKVIPLTTYTQAVYISIFLAFK